MKKVKITVLRKEFYSDFAEQYLSDGIRPVIFSVEAIDEIIK